MNDIERKIIEDVSKSLQHFEYSFNKVKKINLNQELNEETLETLESFSSRFARLSDLFIVKFLRFKIKLNDPAFRGTLIDSLNLAEKMNLIEDSKEWLRIRELRNLAAHENSTEDYKALYRELISLSPELLKIKKVL